jgi:hypothetical protein
MRFRVVHYRNLALCRVPSSLPSIFCRALGKEVVCRVPRKKPSVKENTRRRSCLPSVLFLALGKELFAECCIFDTRQRALCRVSKIQHSAKSSLPSAKNKTLGKQLLRRVFSFTEGFLRGTRQTTSLPSARQKILGKELGTRQRAKFR